MRFTIENEPIGLNRKRRFIFFWAIMLVSLVGGCTVTPKKLFVKDRSRSFEAGTIISGKTGTPVSFKELSAALTASRIIYVGERHTAESHHQIQLKIIQAVFKEHPDMAVGMEMFDHSYQEILDLWSAGKLDQKTFIRKVHWYANWRFDFALYGDILNFIKENRIRLVGLNIPFHIPPKIRVGGIENLRNEEKEHLPKEIDTSNEAHRKYVSEVFEQHHFGEMASFEDFYAAQSVWEDAMAEAIARNLNGGIMVVLAGNGHIQYAYGIPERAFRRTDASYRTIFLAEVGSEVALDVADYIWVTP